MPQLTTTAADRPIGRGCIGAHLHLRGTWYRVWQGVNGRRLSSTLAPRESNVMLVVLLFREGFQLVGRSAP
jgi:hypothetical protein